MSAIDEGIVTAAANRATLTTAASSLTTKNPSMAAAKAGPEGGTAWSGIAVDSGIPIRFIIGAQIPSHRSRVPIGWPRTATSGTVPSAIRKDATFRKAVAAVITRYSVDPQRGRRPARNYCGFASSRARAFAMLPSRWATKSAVSDPRTTKLLSDSMADNVADATSPAETTVSAEGVLG